MIGANTTASVSCQPEKEPQIPPKKRAPPSMMAGPFALSAVLLIQPSHWQGPLKWLARAHQTGIAAAAGCGVIFEAISRRRRGTSNSRTIPPAIEPQPSMLNTEL